MAGVRPLLAGIVEIIKKAKAATVILLSTDIRTKTFQKISSDLKIFSEKNEKCVLR
jgi:hypothetical protein